MNKRPNIIIFNPDEMRADALGHLGNPAAHTPFLDGFAKSQAVSFANAFCQNPVCVPSRCSFFTGLYPHVRGHRTMSYLLREGESSMFSELKDAGYYVWMNARNDLVAAGKPGALMEHASEIYYGGDAAPAPGPEKPAAPLSDSFRAHYGGKLLLDQEGRNYSSDDADVDAAIEMIRRKPADQPLCLFLGLIYPHPPYQVEEPYFSMIDRNLLPDRILPQECSGKARIEEAVRHNQKLEGYTEEQWKKLRAVYLGMTAKVDVQFEKLCRALKEAGEYDNSAIFFLSDHGDFTGDYGISEKAQNTFEDCLTRVPLLIKPPADYSLDPGITYSLTELVDFYATVMEFAGVVPDHTHFGKALQPVLSDRGKELRSFATCEGGRMPDEVHCDEFHAAGPRGTSPCSPYYPRHLAQTDADAHAKGYMLRTQQYKLVSRVNGQDEFYDLSKDPGERTNCICNPEYADIIRDLQHEQLLWFMRTADIVPFDYDPRFSKEMIWAKVKNLVPPEYENEIRKEIDDGVPMFSLIMSCRSRFGGKNFIRRGACNMEKMGEKHGRSEEETFLPE